MRALTLCERIAEALTLCNSAVPDHGDDLVLVARSDTDDARSYGSVDYVALSYFE